MALTNDMNRQEFTFEIMGGGDETNWAVIKAFVNGGYDISTLITLAGECRFASGEFIPTGTAAFGNANGFGGIDLAATGTGGASVVRSFPASWNTANLSWGYIPLAGGGGNVAWRVSINRVNVLNLGVQNEVTDTPQVITTVTAAAGAINTVGHIFNTPSGFAVHNTDGLFGDIASIHIERLGDDAGDTYAGVVRLTNASVIRVS